MHPAVLAPCGFGDDGMPVAFRIVGRHFEDATVPRTAHAHEAAHPFALPEDGRVDLTQRRPPRGLYIPVIERRQAEDTAMKRIFGWASVSAVGLWSTPGFAQGYEGRDYFWHSGWGWGHMVFGSLMMIAFWGGLIVLAVLLIRGLGGGSGDGGRTGRRTPLEILEERYARGEIDHEEFDNRRKSLGP